MCSWKRCARLTLMGAFACGALGLLALSATSVRGQEDEGDAAPRSVTTIAPRRRTR